MKVSKARIEAAALLNAALSDLLATGDEQLRQEAIQEGEDLDTIAAMVGGTMQAAVAAVRRQNLMRAKEQTRQRRTLCPAVLRPTLDRMKELIQGAFEQDKNLGLAFREGKKQTEADWATLYDDLVAIGAIQPKQDDQ